MRLRWKSPAGREAAAAWRAAMDGAGGLSAMAEDSRSVGDLRRKSEMTDAEIEAP
ncbi:hypothetical protein MKK75_19365 [Methylobacterium sp. J-030]|uniref:hypothetical protein n=1 Tax=Methylobacterium sp. J-030 TaxID=2836627 RepID=UPI001FBA2EE8|nr:hypothetical protein [Methylobacterium sp. J-030]MCJ2070922.1 hypothetical protein [Methylobacterium sp. J-030]